MRDLMYRNFKVVGSPPCPAVVSGQSGIVGDCSDDLPTSLPGPQSLRASVAGGCEALQTGWRAHREWRCHNGGSCQARPLHLRLLGFTLLEVMIVMALFGLVMAGTIEVYIMCSKFWHATALSMDTSRMASLAIQRMVYGVGTNSGLRSAASISVNTNVHKDSCSIFVNYWDTPTNSPPAANNDSVNTFCPYTSPPLNDGSWRIVMSNAFDGVKWIDYVKQQRSIVFWQNTAQPASRVSVCNYVINGTVSTNATGITIQLTVWKKDGMFVSSNQVSMFVKIRNKF